MNVEEEEREMRESGRSRVAVISRVVGDTLCIIDKRKRKKKISERGRSIIKVWTAFVWKK